MTDALRPSTPAGGLSYRLRPSIEVFVDDDIHLLRPGEPDLAIRDPEPADVKLIEHLMAGPATIEALSRELGLQPLLVDEKVQSLVTAGAVIERSATLSPPLAADDAERFSRQLPYLAEIGDEIALQRRLREATVAVLGCGGLGTWAIAALAGAGVGRFVLIDHDRVEVSNLNRQMLYTSADVGSSKVEACAAWLRAFDPSIVVQAVERRIERADDVSDAVATAEVVILAADWPPYEIARWVNAACSASQTPFIVAGQVPPILKVGPTYVPGSGACFSCHETALRQASSAYDRYVASRKEAPATASTLGPASGVVGSLLGLEVMHLLLGCRPATLSTALIVDIRTLQLRREPIPRRPDCATCHDLVL